MVIDKIDSLTEKEAKELASEIMEIKGHQCYLIDFDDRFGYSILIFKNGKHIYHADDYELYHGYTVKNYGKEHLRNLYIEEMNNKLYTDEELLEPIKTYEEYEHKGHFLRNYWIMRYDYATAFYIGEKQKKEVEQNVKKYPFYNPVSYCYVSDKAIVADSIKYEKFLEKEFKRLKDNLKVFREMVSYELANHEAGYTGSYEDGLSALGLSFNQLSEEKQKIVLEELYKQIHGYEEEK